MVHPSAGGHYFLGGALGLGGAALEHKGVVVELEVVYSKALGLTGLDLDGQRHQVPDHLAAEAAKVLGGIAVAAHADKAQGHVVFKAQLFSLFCAVFHQLIVQLVKLLPVLVKEAALSLYCRLAHRAVRVLLIGPQLGDGDGLAHKLDAGAGVQLLILSAKPVFLLQERDNFRGKGLELQLYIRKQQRSQLLLKLPAEGRGHQNLVKGLHLFGNQRVLSVEILLLLLIELIPGVHGIADGTDAGKGVKTGHQLILRVEDFQLGLGVGCVL